MEVNKETFTNLIEKKLEDEYLKRLEEANRLKREIETFGYAKKSKFFKITTEDGVRFKWSADIVKSKIEVWLYD